MARLSNRWLIPSRFVRLLKKAKKWLVFIATTGVYRCCWRLCVLAGIWLDALAEMDEADAFARLKMLGGVALITGLISMVAAAGVGITFATSASRPIRKLTDATKRLADGDMSYRVEIARKDEIGALASSFDSMADKLSKEIDGHIQAKEKLAERENYLKTIVDSEPDCVKLIAADGAILEMNAAGLAMVEAGSPEQVIGRSVYSIIIPEYHEAFRALTERAFSGRSGHA